MRIFMKGKGTEGTGAHGMRVLEPQGFTACSSSIHTQEKNTKDKPKLSHTCAMLQNFKVRSFHRTISQMKTRRPREAGVSVRIQIICGRAENGTVRGPHLL